MAVFAIALCVRAPLLNSPGFPADQTQFVQWSHLTQTGGLKSVYSKRPDGRFWCNYPPGYVLVLSVLGTAQNAFANPIARLTDDSARSIWEGRPDPAARLATWLQKIPAVLADAILVALLLRVLTDRVGTRFAWTVALAYSISPAVLHDSCLWGQVDAIHTLLLILSLEAARRKRIPWMSFWAMVSILFKAQSILLLPLWLASAWVGLRERPGVAAKSATAAALPALLILAPFTGAMDGVWAAYRGAANYYPYTHLNGFSAWFAAAPLQIPHLDHDISKWYARDDRPSSIGLTPRTIGLTAIIALWAYVGFVLLRARASDSSLRWAAKLLPLGFFIVSTQMHERYLFPAVALWAWAGVRDWKWWAMWGTVNVMTAINMAWVWTPPGGILEGIQRFARSSDLGLPFGQIAAMLLVCVATFTLLARAPRPNLVTAEA